MFWELSEVVTKCMVVFKVVNFDLVTEILKIQCHLYFNEDGDYSEENTCAMKSFASP